MFVVLYRELKINNTNHTTIFGVVLFIIGTQNKLKTK